MLTEQIHRFEPVLGKDEPITKTLQGDPRHFPDAVVVFGHEDRLRAALHRLGGSPVDSFAAFQGAFNKREVHLEHGTRAWLALDLHETPMLLGDAVNGGQTQASALT